MRRFGLALTVLTAVFLMHGLQCLGDGGHPRPDHGAAPPDLSLPVLLPSGVLSPPGTEHGHAAPDASPAGGLQPGHVGTTSGPDPTPGQFWALCLAVLSAGLALLAALAFRPRIAVPRASARPAAQRWISAPALLRPPDPFSLCVLRN